MFIIYLQFLIQKVKKLLPPMNNLPCIDTSKILTRLIYLWFFSGSRAVLRFNTELQRANDPHFN